MLPGQEQEPLRLVTFLNRAAVETLDELGPFCTVL
jgi:hypothetical protein